MIIRRTCAATPADFLAFVSPELHFRRLEQEFSADEKLKRIDTKEKNNTRAQQESVRQSAIFLQQSHVQFSIYLQHRCETEASVKADFKIFGYNFGKAASSSSTVIIGSLEFSAARRRKSNFTAATFVSFFPINKPSRASWIRWMSSSLRKIVKR